MLTPDRSLWSIAAVNRRRFLWGSAGVLTGFGASAARAMPVAGHVSAVRGDANAELDGSKRVLSTGGDVFVHDLVSTGRASRLTLKLGTTTTVRLGADTRLKIDQYMLDAEGDFELVEGVIKFDGKGKPGSGRSTFRSAYGLIAIRGTRFYAGPSRGKFAVLVGEGTVEVTAGDKTVLVGPQQGTDIARPGDAPSPPKEWPLDRIKEMQASTE